MLNRLTISNFALIDNLNLRFKPGYSVITGETGAGKSIILKALNLLLGERADYSVIKIKEDKCVIEAEFNVADLGLEDQFNSLDVDYHKSAIIRREFLPSGKSRLFINDTPTTLSSLKAIGGRIIKIHTQHETLELFDKQFHLNTLDSFASLNSECDFYRSIFSIYQKNIALLNKLEEQVVEHKKAQDYNQFLIDEFEKANFKSINVEELLAESEELEHWEQIQNQLTFCLSILTDEHTGPSQSLKKGIDALNKISHISTKYEDLLNRFKSVTIDLDDIEGELSEMMDSNEINEERVSVVQSQIQTINSLLFKHNCSNGKELANVLSNLEAEIHSFSDLEEQIADLKNEIAEQKMNLADLANNLTKKRKASAPILEQSIQSLLSELGMTNAEIKIDFSTTDSLTHNGRDALEYLFKTNLGGQFLPVSKTASGGELSRLMLSLLHVISSVEKLPTLIFDEIDTGVSGEIASKMASLFSKMGTNTQLISISHLPQIASKAKVHYHVYKTTTDHSTSMLVKELSISERVTELAKMMSGENVSEKAIENAKLLLDS
ncbi:MAG: DNA repair protein RecN [Crocinitomicaceae bacterium]